MVRTTLLRGETGDGMCVMGVQETGVVRINCGNSTQSLADDSV